MAHGDGGFFVTARQPLGHRIRVGTVIDEGFVEAVERRARVGCGVLDVQGLEDVDHEVRAWILYDAIGGRGAGPGVERQGGRVRARSAVAAPGTSLLVLRMAELGLSGEGRGCSASPFEK